jgi:hypothetical protein
MIFYSCKNMLTIVFDVYTAWFGIGSEVRGFIGVEAV